MTTFPVTTIYALLTAIILLALFMNVTLRRSKIGQSIGDGGDVDLHERIRRHGNFVEWTPMVLILLALAEANQASTLALHVSGSLLVVGRVLHPFGLKTGAPTHPLRIAGNMGAILATLILVVLMARSVIAI
ncbi:MAG: MAPEG family protein [Rhabdaerophilum sp.]